MAIIDVVKWETKDKELVHKFPSEDLRVGTQLVVYSGQTAFFVRGGVITESFEAGRYTLKSENIPFINRAINSIFGNRTPFQAEVWIVNKLAILDSKWGTTTPIQLEDPKYGVIVPIRAFGQYGLKVADPRLLIEALVSNMSTISTDKIDSYFKGKMMSFFTNLISDKITKDNISVLNINSYLSEMSEYVQKSLDVEFAKFGLSLADFNIISINIPENDSSFKKLKQAKEMFVSVNVPGQDTYKLERTFNVLDKSAQNDGVAGAMMSLGVGLGAGPAVGRAMTENTNSSMYNGSTNSQGTQTPPKLTNSMTPPPVPSSQYYFIADNKQEGPHNIDEIKEYINAKIITTTTLMWRQGMKDWDKAVNFNEFQGVLRSLGEAPPKDKPQEYFIKVEGKQDGPYNDETIRQLIRDGIILRFATFMWKKGMKEWMTAYYFDEFRETFERKDDIEQERLSKYFEEH